MKMIFLIVILYFSQVQASESPAEILMNIFSLPSYEVALGETPSKTYPEVINNITCTNNKFVKMELGRRSFSWDQTGNFIYENSNLSDKNKCVTKMKVNKRLFSTAASTCVVLEQKGACFTQDSDIGVKKCSEIVNAARGCCDESEKSNVIIRQNSKGKNVSHNRCVDEILNKMYPDRNKNNDSRSTR